MTNDKKIVMYDSPEAAKQVTVTGWLSRLNHFFGDDEHIARYDGCTHRPCNTCGSPTEKHYIYCETCRNQREIEKYKEMPRKPWDGDGMIYSEAADKFFSDWGEVEDYLYDNSELPEENSLKAEDLRLVICKPQYLCEVETTYWEDALSTSDGDEIDPPDEVIEALRSLNEAIKKAGPVSWQPGKYAVIIDR